MNIKPLSNHIVLEPLKEDEKTESGILLPETAEREPEQAKVIAVGSGRKTASGKIVPVDVKPGDIVLFIKYGPTEVKVEGKKYLIAKEEDILAILEQAPE